MKKYLLIAGLGLLTAGGVTAAVLNNGKKKTVKKASHCSMQKSACKAYKTACY
jgi:hypothetical protein